MNLTAQSGFSIIEVMVSLVVVLAIMAGLFGMMIQNQKVFESEMASADMQQSLRVAVDFVAGDLRALIPIGTVLVESVLAAHRTQEWVGMALVVGVVSHQIIKVETQLFHDYHNCIVFCNCSNG